MPNVITRLSSWVGLTKSKPDAAMQQRNYNQISLVTENEHIAKILGIDLGGGIAVNELNALGLSAVLACVRLRGDGLASMPIRVFKKTARGQEDDINHSLHYLLNVRPNDYQTPMVFRSTMSMHRDLYGMALAVIKRNQYRQVTSLHLIQPKDYTLLETFNEELNDFVYTPMINKTGQVLKEEEFIAWRGVSVDGMLCKGIVGLMIPTLKTGLTLREFVNKYYQNGGFISGILSFEQNLSPQNADLYKKNWQEANGGVKNAGKVAVLGSGAKFTPINNTFDQSQFVEFLAQDRLNIYQAFGVPAHLVSDTEKSTSFGKGLEEMSKQFFVYTLRPMAKGLEQELHYKCLRTTEQSKYSVHHDPNVYMEARYEERIGGLVKLVQSGIITPNEARAVENMPQHPDGNTLIANGNMTPVKTINENQQSNGEGI